ncbi:hypothetical protein Gotur_017532, partial [Gossypium turneri]
MEFMEWFTWVLLNRHKRSGAETTKFILQYIQDLKDTDRKHLTLSLDSDLWRPLKQGFFKINFDAAFDNTVAIACLQAVTVGRDLGMK